jgi:hypothetical protein
VVASKDDHELRIRGFDEAQIVVDGVSGAGVPFLPDIVRFRRYGVVIFAKSDPTAPGLLDMLVQRIGVVLG